VDVALTVHCSVGTYVRALADDLGRALGVGGHLSALRRTRAGTLSLDGAISLDTIESQAEAWRDERTARAEAGDPVRFEPERNTATWRPFLGAALRPVEELLGGVAVLPITASLIPVVHGGTPLRKRDVASLVGFDGVAFVPGDRLVLQHPDGTRAVALAQAAVARDALSRLPDDAIVLQIERVLR
jgi:tRNA U55 pseudouridine synthase TruB